MKSDGDGGTLLWAIVIAAGWIAQRIQASRKKAAQTRPGQTATATGEAERTRQVQEQIRRRVEERLAGRRPEGRLDQPPASRSLPPVVATPPVPATLPDFADEPAPDLWTDRAPAEVQDLAADLRATQAVAYRVAASSSPPKAMLGPLAVGEEAPVSPWLTELREPRSVRRAVLLREILGPPVGLR